jgi:hypothetical protein
MTRHRVDLWDLISATLLRQARELLAELADDEQGRAIRDEIAADFAEIESAPARRLRFRWDWRDAPRERERARSLMVAVDVVTRDGAQVLPLLTVRVQNLCLADGTPVDTAATVRELSASIGLGRVPDDPGELIDAQRDVPRPESGSVEGRAAFLRCAIAALLRPASKPRACCDGRGDRELSGPHLDAHALADGWAYRSGTDREAYRRMLVRELHTLDEAA